MSTVGPSTYHRPEHRAGLPAETRDLIERREHALGAAYRLFYEEPVEFVRGSGTKLFTADGAEFLDVYNNVPSVGHAHPHVANAVGRQIATLNTHTRYLDRALVDYSERLLATLPGDRNIMFTCTGSEANDLALRLAKFSTGATGVIVTEHAYHGVTTEIAAISPSLGGLDSLADWTRVVPAPTGDGSAFVEGVRAAVLDLQACGHGVAALVVDTIFASDGVLPGADAAGWLAAASDLTRASGGLVIADEVQPGFGRLGHGMWGFTRHGITPDIITVGKPMGNGIPIAATIARRDLVDAFGASVRYFNTFGGTPVSIAAAAATLDVIENEGLIENARTVGSALQTMLADVAARHPRIGGLRGVGLFQALDIVDAGGTPDEPATIALVNELRRRRVLISASGKHNHSLKIRPPLPFSAADAERFVTELDGALGALA